MVHLNQKTGLPPLDHFLTTLDIPHTLGAVKEAMGVFCPSNTPMCKILFLHLNQSY